MKKNCRENVEKMPTDENFARQKADRSRTKQDVAEVSMSLSEVSRLLEVLIETELPANAVRLVARASMSVNKAQLAAKNAAYRLENGK